MKVEFPVSMPREDALARLQALGDYLSNRHGISVAWTGDAARFSGRYKKLIKIEGNMSFATDTLITFEGEDPGFALRGQAKGYIKRKLEEYLNPSTPLDELPRR